MWGGTPDRNMVSHHEGHSRPPGTSRPRRTSSGWRELGSQSYGNPVVAGGQVYVGTNNELVRNPKEARRPGRADGFRESDGKFLWQHANEKLAAGRANDWPFQGVCSSPLVEGDRLYYVTNRCELVCLDTKGDGNGDAKVIWKFDMMEEVGSQPHNMSNSSPVSYGDLIYRQHLQRPGRKPRAHSLAARARPSSRSTRRPASWSWEDNNVGEKILHGQWSSAAVGKIGDVVQVVIGQGDGWVRGYEALTGKKLWEFDMNPKDSVWPKTRNEVIAHAGDLREQGVHRQRPGSGARRGRRATVRDRRHQARRHHADRPHLALRQDPPLDFDRRDLQRPAVLLRFQRLPALPGREDRQAVLDARHAGRRLGLADGDRRQGVSGRRRRRRRGAGSSQGEEADRAK